MSCTFCQNVLSEFTASGIYLRLEYRHAISFIFIVQVSDLFWSMHVLFAFSHPGLSNKLSKDIEHVQKRCLKIIYPKLSYSEALEKSGIVCLAIHREEITQSTFKQVKCPTHPLHHMLPPCKVSTSQITLRPTYHFQLQSVRKQHMVKI